jgi:hypothetical protein
MKNRGFTLLIAIVVTGMLLLVSFVVANLALKQIIITYSGQESQYAFYNADSAVECAMYWDFKENMFAAGSGPIYCNNQTISEGNPILGSTLGQTVTFGSGSGSGNTATFTGTDVVTQGNWKGVYGSSETAYRLANVYQDFTNLPSYANVNVNGNNTWDWDLNSSESRTLQVPTGWTVHDNPTATRFLSTWYTPGGVSQFTMDVNITDNKLHKVTLYMVDWENAGRNQTIQIVDSSSRAILDSQTVSNFSNGIYLSWNVSGHVEFKIINNNPGTNAVISGIFFDNTVGANSTSLFGVDYSQNNGHGCAIVVVTKSGGNTIIESRGYNTCDTTADRRFERAVRITY